MSWASSHAGLILWLLGLVQMVTYAIIQPVWSRVDEAQHFHFVQYLAENRALPVMGDTFISREVVAVSLEVDQWFWFPAHSIQAPVNLDPSAWQKVPPYLHGDDKWDWIAGNLWYFSYEAMQPPLYYSLGALTYWMLPDNTFLQIYVVRVLTAILASFTVLLAIAIVREAFPKNDMLAIGVPATIALLPGLVLNLSQITNDSLVTTLATLCLYLLVRGLRRGLGMTGSVVIGLVIGMALLTKLTAFYLVPLAFTSLALACLRFPNRLAVRKSLASGMALSLTVVAVLFPWLLRNLTTYGDVAGSGIAREMMGSYFRPVPVDSLEAILFHLADSFKVLVSTFWFGEPFPPWPNWDFAFYGLWMLSLLSILGLALYFWRWSRERHGEWIMTCLMLAVVVINLAQTMILPTLGGTAVVGRYMYPSVVPILSLLWLGIHSLVRDEAQRLLLVVFVGGLVVLNVVNLVSYIQSNYGYF